MYQVRIQFQTLFWGLALFHSSFAETPNDWQALIDRRLDCEAVTGRAQPPLTRMQMEGLLGKKLPPQEMTKAAIRLLARYDDLSLEDKVKLWESAAMVINARSGLNWTAVKFEASDGAIVYKGERSRGFPILVFKRDGRVFRGADENAKAGWTPHYADYTEIKKKADEDE